MKEQKLFIIDVFPIIYRAHFAMLNQHFSNSKGLNTAAILGFYNYLFQILFQERPTHIAAAFDSKSLERSVTLKQYKANRDSAPEEVINAVKWVREIIEALKIKKIELHGYEADDVIGTIALKAAKKGFKVFIVSPDKDFAQLVSENIYLFRPPYKGTNFEVLDAEKVKEKYGVPPGQIADYLALKGDPADNVPGLPKIGEKTAQRILSTYQDVEEILEHLDDFSGAIKETFIKHTEELRLYKNVATINTSLALNFNSKEYAWGVPDADKVTALLEELEFKKLKERITKDRVFKKFFLQKEEEKDPTRYHLGCNCIHIDSEKKLNEMLTGIIDEFYFQMHGSKNSMTIFFCISNKIYAYSFPDFDFPAGLLDIFNDPSIKAISYDIKPFIKMLYLYGYPFHCNLFDLKVAHYIYNSEENHSFDNMISSFTNKAIPPELSIELKKCIETKSLKKIKLILKKKLSEKEKNLLETLEFPLIPVLAQMEITGVKFDKEALHDVSEILKEKLKKVEDELFELAGERINLKSAKQVSQLLSKIIDPLTAKKTKTGQVSTSESILIDLAPNNRIAELLLSVRKLGKIISTYTESLPQYINKRTGRIHPDFKQTTTATGRLSCADPNLQNLPIIYEEGREVRRTLVPENHQFVIVAADYSQIELRLLAALSKDNTLIFAFKNHQDIHNITAAKVFGVKEAEVTKDLRAKAKMVNYGIPYGLSAFGLSQNLKITLNAANQIIDNYFAEFDSIKNYIQEHLEYARKKGYTETLLGRRRYIRDINSRNGTVRKNAERIAINAPLQGLAADIIKLAMIKIDKAFRKEKLKSKMILQVHDELVFEVYKPELEKAIALIKNCMEKPIDLGIPLEVNIGTGENWLDLKKTETKEHKKSLKKKRLKKLNS